METGQWKLLQQTHRENGLKKNKKRIFKTHETASSSLYIIGIPEGQEIKQNPFFCRKKLLIIWKALRHSMTDSGSSENAKHKRMPVKTIFSYMIFQLQKTKNNEKILKESRRGPRKTTYRATIKRITVEFSQDHSSKRR